ncbi:hypothetical protein SmJEL517_g02404 [Synchytrium microbalum]|uniref:Uncharacterized protein n=1 Tax=Synchytrium microbalum TaxID=1806994 RepID=A0A507C0I0_9FUNG|nr:uncharacterized protein SmJEL517_g02404 [Synchytrium microbalum]TPX35040.1 hypothetical protein SmJEL517_g02404 [Synchytrium microbalum]
MSSSSLQSPKKATGPVQSPKLSRERISTWLNFIPQLLSQSKISNIERVVNLLRHAEESDGARQQIGRCPGVTYVPNLLQGTNLHQVLASFDLTKSMTWESIVKALESGKIEMLVKKGVNVDPIAIENILLPLVYIACHSGELVPGALRDIPRQISKKILGISRTSKLPADTWSSAFTDCALRMHDYESPTPIISNILMNEMLETIRIKRLQEAGFIAPFPLSSKGLELPRGSEQRLAGILSCSFYTVIEFSKRSEYMTVENLHILASHGGRLPAAWFTSEFLAASVKVAETLMIDDLDKPSAAKGLGAISALWSFWIRKTTTYSQSPHAASIMEMLKTLVQTEATDPTTLLYSTVSLLSSYPPHPASEESKNAEYLKELCSLLPTVYPRLPTQERDLTRASIAQVFRKLPATEIKAYATALLNGVAAAPFEANDIAQLIYLIQFGAVQQWEAMQPVIRPIWRRVFGGEMYAERTVPDWTLDMLEACQEVGGIVGSAAAAGVARSAFLSKADPKHFVVTQTIRRDILDRAFEIITVEVSKRIADENDLIPSSVRDGIAVICSSTVGAVTDHEDIFTLPKFDWRPLIKQTVASLLHSSDTLSLPSNTFDLLSSGTISPSLHDLLTQRADPKARTFMYGEVSRMAYGIGLMAAVVWKDGEVETVESVLNDVHSMIASVSKAWETCTLNSNPPKAIEATTTALWSHFRIMLFCVTSIFKHITDVLPDRPDLDASPALTKLFMVLRDIHFVTVRFGSEGFKAWQGVISGCCAWFHTHIRRQLKLKPDDVIYALIGDLEADLYIAKNPVYKTQLTFCMLLSRQLARHLSDKILSQDLLPKCYPYLFLSYKPEAPLPREPPSEDKDLFEACHAVCLAILERGGGSGNVVQDLAGWYGAALLEAYPDPIDYDILRRGFTLSVRACSFASSANSSASVGMNAIHEAEEAKENAESNIPDTPNALLTSSPDESDDDTNNNNKDDAINNATPKLPSQQDTESDAMAWSLIARLLHKIQILNDRIAHPENEAVPDFSKGGSKGRRIDLILEASPLTRLNLQRDQLTMVLFDSIRVVGLNGLEGVLNVIETLLLDGYVPAWATSGIENTTATATSDTHHEPASVEEEESTHHTPYTGIGIQSNPDTSPLWQSLISTIGHAKGFDYARKTRCVGWYMNTLHAARDRWREFVNRELTKERVVGPVLPQGHPLRARL